MSSSLRAHPRTRWWALAVIALTQLVVVLDGTIVSIALPRAQQSLDLSDGQRQWVVTAYALAFGALLLLGGRLSDYVGRKRIFMIGMVGFGAASLYGGFAQQGWELILARGLQGAFAALLAPAALALLTVTFPSGRDRNTAFAVFGIVAGTGAAVGLLLGGVLTEFADWRWCLFVNLFFVAVGLVGGALFLTESRADGDTHYDVWGTITVTLGLGALVYGFSLAENGWGQPLTIAFLALGAALLGAFVWIESRVAHPLLPPRIVADRVRGGAFLIQGVAGAIMIGATMYLTFHLQFVLGMGAFTAGLATLPLPIATMVVAPLATRLLPVIGPRPMLIVGPLLAAAGMLYLSGITPDGAYFLQVAPALVILGVGMAFVFVPLQNLALTGIASEDAGVASAVANSAMQIGGSIGLSVFTAVYAASVGGHAQRDVTAQQLTDAYGWTFIVAAIFLVGASVIAVCMVRGSKDELMPAHGELAVAAH